MMRCSLLVVLGGGAVVFGAGQNSRHGSSAFWGLLRDGSLVPEAPEMRRSGVCGSA